MLATSSHIKHEIQPIINKSTKGWQVLITYVPMRDERRFHWEMKGGSIESWKAVEEEQGERDCGHKTNNNNIYYYNLLICFGLKW